MNEGRMRETMIRETIFSLPEGIAILSFPEPMSRESLEEVEEFVWIVLRGLRRRTLANGETSSASSPE